MATKRFFMVHHDDFKNLLNLNVLVPFLNKRHLLTSGEMEQLMSPSRTRQEKIRDLVNIMCIKGDQAPSLFIKCVRDATEHIAHSDLAEKLESWLLKNSTTDMLIASSGSEPTSSSQQPSNEQQPKSRATTIQDDCKCVYLY